MIFAKIIIILITLLVLVTFLFLSNYDSLTDKVIVILVLSAIPNSFGNFFLNSYKIINRFDKEAIGYLIQGMSLLALLLINEIYGSATIVSYAIILLLARMLYFTYSLVAFKRGFFNKFKFNMQEVFLSLKTATPYGVHLILGSSIIYIDTFIISFLSNITNVGLYQAGMRIIMASMLIAIIISDAFIPEISRIFKDKDLASKKLSNLFNFILLFSSATLIVLYFYKKTIIILLFSQEYLVLEAAIPLILSIIFLRYIGIVPGIILTSYDKQIIRARAVVASLLFSVLFNLTLIPIYGIKGAFMASLIAHIILNIIYGYYAIKTLNFVKNISLVLLLGFVLLNVSMQLTFSSDTRVFLGITIILNAIFFGYYFIIINGNNTLSQNR